MVLYGIVRVITSLLTSIYKGYLSGSISKVGHLAFAGEARPKVDVAGLWKVFDRHTAAGGR